MVGTVERRLYVASVALAPVVFAMYINTKLQQAYPALPLGKLPLHLQKSPLLSKLGATNLTEGFYVDIPGAWFALPQAKERQVAHVIFDQLWFHLAQGAWLSLWNGLGLCTYVGQSDLVGGKFEEELCAVANRTDVSFQKVNGWRPRVIFGGMYSIVAEPLDRQTVRLWFVSHLVLKEESEALRVSDTWTHRVLGQVPQIQDAETGRAVTNPFLVAAVWWERFYARLMVDCALQRMMVKKPLMLFFDPASKE